LIYGAIQVTNSRGFPHAVHQIAHILGKTASSGWEYPCVTLKIDFNTTSLLFSGMKKYVLLMINRYLGIAKIISVLIIFADPLTNHPVLGDTAIELTYMLFGVGSMRGVARPIKLHALGTNTVTRALR
jgi:hypothetical protein